MEGLRAALPAAAGLAASGAIVFGVQRLVPTYDHTWYMGLKKPFWNPPNWLFPAAWIPLKVLQTVALWLVWTRARQSQDLLLPALVYGVHLTLGNMWNVIFFGRHKLRESLGWMAAFWASTLGTIGAFSSVLPLAAWLVAPTLGWVSIAAKLNYDIFALNKSKDAAN